MSSTKAFEVNFDGLVGPTHNYSGLSYGNVASIGNQAAQSNPLEGVLQGLKKMKTLSELGLKQGLLPPQERPDIATLKKLGFSGSEKEILENVAKASSAVLSAVSSASCMWTANAATVSPSADTADGKVHFTPANLISKFHRSIEPETTSAGLRAIFKDPRYFAHHDPLPASPQFGDEGAANHTRLCASSGTDYGKKGVEFFVFGRHGFLTGAPEPRKFPARQTLDASAAVARMHGLDTSAVVFGQQNPEAIDAGVFHNDVAGVGNQGVYFYHEQALLDSARVMDELQKKYALICGEKLLAIEVPANQVSMQDAVTSYLFNSQLVTLPTGGMALILPTECEANPAVFNYVKQLQSEHSKIFTDVRYLEVKQSMRNGGGPACLRLRVVLTEQELAGTHQRVLMNDQLYGELVTWAKKHYRDRLTLDDLRDVKLLTECRTALDELTTILGVGSIYPFQRAAGTQRAAGAQRKS
jgi:succinylarginine dihydrolase